MQSMEQCLASVTAMKIAEEKRTWHDVSPDVDSLQCVEVK